MTSSIQKLTAIHYVYIFTTQICSFIYFLILIDIISAPKKNDKKYPGIDIKEFM